MEIWLTENGVTKKVVFSGDIGNINQPIIHDPHFTESADYVIMECTYGDRTHNAPKRWTAAETLSFQRSRSDARRKCSILSAKSRNAGW